MTTVHKPISDKLFRLLAAGAPLADALRIVLAADPSKTNGAIPAFAARHALNPTNTRTVFVGNRTPWPELLDALISELGGTRAEWRELFWKAQKPTPDTNDIGHEAADVALSA